ncbi:transcription factor IIIC subunit delta N-term-domain-containing protein [Cytidiella melzeri]|nr:transcription factor IIIC subunit delta N-term-domain-containing protein [Cytidiella melzeri]
MTVHSVLATLSIPAVSTFPSERCIQWSGDGQVVVLTRQAIMIITPTLGISVEPSSITKQANDSQRSDESLGWYRTMIERNKDHEPHQWAMDCQDWSAVALGSMDLSFVDVACSPSNLSSNAGCIFAVLDSNYEVSLYHTVKNHLTGQWQKVRLRYFYQHVATYIKSLVSLSIRTAERIDSIFIGIAWSSQGDFCISPVSSLNASLLAIGTCAGAVHLLRHVVVASVSQDVTTIMNLIETVQLSDKKITHIAWSSWTLKSTLQVEAFLACGSADGSIVVLMVTQSLVLPSSPSASHVLSVIVTRSAPDTPCKSTRRTTGALRWINLPDSEPVLVFSKPGTVSLWRPDNAISPWSGLKTVALQVQKLSVGSTALAPVSGIAHIPRRDTVVVTLSDGSFHVVKNVSSEPLLVSDNSEGDENKISSKSLSTVARQHFVRIEGEETRKLDVNSTHGMASADNGSTFLWVHEALRPTDFSYKHDAQHSNVVVMAELFGRDLEGIWLEELGDTIRNVSCTSGDAPIAILRASLVRLRSTETISKHAKSVLGVLGSIHPVDDSTDISLPQWFDNLTAEMREQYRRSLRMHIFGRHALLSQRLKAFLAGFCEKRCSDKELRDSFRLTGISTTRDIWSTTLRILVRHIAAALQMLTPNDIPFARRTAIHGSCSGNADVKAEADQLFTTLATRLPAPTPYNLSSILEEPCPACHSLIPFVDLTSAVCPNGHHWLRCSITSFILTTPMVRTCMGCTRKAFLPPRPGAPATSWLPVAARSWLVEDLLDAVRRCLFCGNSFVTLI